MLLNADTLVTSRLQTSDPHYIYFDAGQDFGRKHAAAYFDAGIAKVSFSCATWALDYLQDQAVR